MKVTHQIYVKTIIQGSSFANETTLEKYYKLGFKNEFATMKEAVEFMTNPENEKYFNLFEEYTILPIFELTKKD